MARWGWVAWFVWILVAPRELLAAMTDADHVRALNAVRNATGCDALDPPYFAARDLPQPTPELARAVEDIFVRRERYGCLKSECPPGHVCPPPPKRQALVDHYAIVKRDLIACLGGASCEPAEEMRLRSQLLDTVVVIVRRYPQSDPFVKNVLEEIGIVIGKDALMRRCSEVLGKSIVETPEVLGILRGIARQVEQGQSSKDILDEVLNILERTNRERPAEPAARVRILRATSQLLKSVASSVDPPDLAAFIAEFGKGEEAGRLRVLLQASRDLADPARASALAQAIQMLLAHNKHLDDGVRNALPPGSIDTPSRLLALVKLMNASEALELLRMREAVPTARFASTSQRRFRVLTVHRPPLGCPEGDAVCELAPRMWEGFHTLLTVRAPQAADSALVPARDAATIIALAVDELNADRSGLKRAPCDALSKGELCAHPYAGVFVLESFREGAQMCGRAYYAIRKTHGVATRQQSLKACKGRADEAFVSGQVLALDALRASTLEKLYVNEAIDRGPHPPRRATFRQWAALGSLVAGAALVGTGVYVSNKEPDSAAGDTLWQGGAFVLLPVSAAFQIWELAL